MIEIELIRIRLLIKFDRVRASGIGRLVSARLIATGLIATVSRNIRRIQLRTDNREIVERNIGILSAQANTSRPNIGHIDILQVGRCGIIDIDIEIAVLQHCPQIYIILGHQCLEEVGDGGGGNIAQITAILAELIDADH